MGSFRQLGWSWDLASEFVRRSGIAVPAATGATDSMAAGGPQSLRLAGGGASNRAAATAGFLSAGVSNRLCFPGMMPVCRRSRWREPDGAAGQRSRSGGRDEIAYRPASRGDAADDGPALRAFSRLRLRYRRQMAARASQARGRPDDAVDRRRPRVIDYLRQSSRRIANSR